MIVKALCLREKTLVYQVGGENLYAASLSGPSGCHKELFPFHRDLVYLCCLLCNENIINNSTELFVICTYGNINIIAQFQKIYASMLPARKVFVLHPNPLRKFQFYFIAGFHCHAIKIKIENHPLNEVKKLACYRR